MPPVGPVGTDSSGIAVGMEDPEKFDYHLTKEEFNAYMAMNFDTFAQVMVAAVKEIESLKDRVKWLEDHHNTRQSMKHDL